MAALLPRGHLLRRMYAHDLRVARNYLRFLRRLEDSMAKKSGGKAGKGKGKGGC